MKWRNHSINGRVFEVDHLHPFDWIHEQPEFGKYQAQTFKFRVIFSHHCFTRDPFDGEVVEHGYWYPYVERGRRRVFCEERWMHSQMLPAIVRDLHRRPVFHTDHQTYFTIELVGEDGEPRDYEVYFDVRRLRGMKGAWLELSVKSAYVRSDLYQSQQPKKNKVRFPVIAAKALHGKKPKPGR